MDESDAIIDTLATLLRNTAEDHHRAYSETDGVDPDWAIWYAGHLIEQGIRTMLDANFTKSELIYLLVLASKEQTLESPGATWERYYARFFADRYLS